MLRHGASVYLITANALRTHIFVRLKKHPCKTFSIKLKTKFFKIRINQILKRAYMRINENKLE